MAYVLWTRFLRHNPVNPHWFNRDRFVLSAGHGSMLLYSLLHLTGYDLPLEQIKQFRQSGDVIGLDHFGASAPGPVLMREFGFTAENVCKRAIALLEKNNA